MQGFPFTRRSAVFLVAAFAAFLPLGTLQAHAVLVSSVPAAGTTIAGPAMTFELRFNSRIDAKRSMVTLVYPNGQSSTLSLDLHGGPDTLRSPVKGLLPGNYTLRWQVLAADGHITRGQVPFTVR